jgi:uncharacterized membrane protein
MKDTSMKTAILAIGVAGLLASACATDPYGNSTSNQTVRQGAIGAGIGAVAGAIIGGAIGGTVGAVRGSQADRNNQQRYRDNRGQYYYCYDNNQNECYWENGQRRY